MTDDTAFDILLVCTLALCLALLIRLLMRSL